MRTFAIPGSLPFMLALALLLPGCGQREAEPVAEPAPDSPGVVLAPDDGEDFELAWQGVLPCADCEGIETRLSLRRDEAGEVFELQETYLGAEGGNVFTASGTWRLENDDDSGAAIYRLGPEGGSQAFALQPDGSLQLLGPDGEPAADPLAFRLYRL